MRKIKINVGAKGSLSPTSYKLGRVGENLSTELLFDVREIEGLFPSASLRFFLTQGDDSSYFLPFVGELADEGFLSFALESASLAKEGPTFLQLGARDDSLELGEGLVWLSEKTRFFVEGGLGKADDIGEPSPPAWIREVWEILGRTEEARALIEEALVERESLENWVGGIGASISENGDLILEIPPLGKED